MFNAISWGQFTGAVLVLLSLYYAYVGLVYYRVELRRLVRGQGNAAGSTPTPALPSSSLIGRRPLIAIPASALAATPSEIPSPAPAPAEAANAEVKEATSTEGTATDQIEALTEQLADTPAATTELPALDLSITDLDEHNVEYFNLDSYGVDALADFEESNDPDSFQQPSSGLDATLETFEPSFTIGIAQLSNYLERAADGQLTQEELAEQEPELADTDLLVAFFQSSTKNAQRATSQLYADVSEPALS